MGYGMRTLVQLTGAAWPSRCAGLCLQAARGGWVGRRLRSSNESALEAWIRDDALYKLAIFTFFYNGVGVAVFSV